MPKNNLSMFTISGMLALAYFSYSIHLINYKYETGVYAIDADSLGLGYAYAFLDSFYIFTLAAIAIYGMRFICQGFSKKLFKK